MSEATSNNSGLGWAFFKLYIFYSWNTRRDAFSNRRIRMVSDLQLDEPHVLTN